MRFLMLMYPSEAAEAGAPVDAETASAMMKYNEEMAKAGVLIALDGLQPSSKGARVSFDGGKPTVTDGPFTEAKEVIGGYWLIRVDSKEEAIEWAKRCPSADAKFIEIRQVFDLSDYPADVQAVADNPTVRAQIEQGGS